MKTLPLSVAKIKLGKLVERMRSHDEEIFITKNGRAAAVLISPEKFASWQETVAIRGDRALMREIRAGLVVLKAKKAKLYALEDLL